MHVRDLGEFQLIELLINTIERRSTGQITNVDTHLKFASGDDAAVWHSLGGTEILATDVLVEGVHFDLATVRWRDVGWKCMAVNLSDIAAMGCVPRYAVVGLGLQGDLIVSDLIEMYEGMLDACNQYNCRLVGGDVVSSSGFFVSVSMTGIGVRDENGYDSYEAVLARSTARVGEQIAITGHIGCSSGGGKMIRDQLKFDQQIMSHLKSTHFRPIPRIPEGVILAKNAVSAAIDVSDGLVGDLKKLCKASEVGAVVKSNKMPADNFLRDSFPNEWMNMALCGGEDYELMFTASDDVIETVTELMEIPVSVIGEVLPASSGVNVIDDDGSRLDIDQGGWDHFSLT
jgi:thiamine-monophosphate kinase